MTEPERARMSEYLTTAVPPDRVSHVLAVMGQELEDATSTRDDSLARGPFGVFQTFEHVPTSSVDTEEVRCDTNASQFDLANLATVDGRLDVSELDFSLDLQLMESSEHETGEVLVVTDLFQPDLSAQALPVQQVDVHEDNDISPAWIHDAHPSQMAPVLVWSQPRMTPGPGVTDDAVFLLNHYVSSLIRCQTIFTHSKTPWHTLVLAQAKTCLASLTMGQSVDDALLCCYYGLLAASATSISSLAESPELIQRAEKYQFQARESAELMLRHAYAPQKLISYKSLLIALLTMTDLSLIFGNRDELERYLLATEKLIRMKGLARVKSRKVRLLHTCYSNTRIFHESVQVPNHDSEMRRSLCRFIGSHCVDVPGQDSCRFHLSSWSALEQEMNIPKAPDVEENDLHYECPHKPLSAFHAEVYGIPQVFVILLSQAIRLVNNANSTGGTDTEAAMSAKEFCSRAKSLETCINRLHEQTTGATVVGMDSQRQRRIVIGMQSALQIYFYRRVYNVDAWGLQRLVVSVRDWLFEEDQDTTPRATAYVGFLWPAFIAACETEQEGVRRFFRNCVRARAKESGLDCYSKTLLFIELLWAKKLDPANAAVTWSDLVRDGITI